MTHFIIIDQYQIISPVPSDKLIRIQLFDLY